MINSTRVKAKIQNAFKKECRLIKENNDIINTQTDNINANKNTIITQTDDINANKNTIITQTDVIKQLTDTIIQQADLVKQQTNTIKQQADFINRQTNTINQQADYLKIITENMTDALFIMNPDGSYAYQNERAYDLAYQSKDFNTHGDSLIHTKYFDAFGKELVKEELPDSRVLRGEKIESLILKANRLDKTTYLSFNGKPVYANGVLTNAILCIRDITEQINNQLEIKKHQEQLINVEKEKLEALEASMKLKEEFLYLITHEFRTPMAVVNSALQAIDLIYKKDVTENVGKHLKTIKQNTNRQLRLVNNLLDITRMNTGNIKLNKCSFDIVYVTNSMVNSVKLYANQKYVNLHFTSSITKKTVFLDEEKYERIMLNLMANALKFTPKNRNIFVSLTIKKQSNRNMVYISVKDEGIGIPKDKQQIIFERFGQSDTSLSRQAEGTGLGLHLVKLMVNALEGEISLVSEESKGSTFTVKLPIVKPVALDEIAVCSEAKSQFENNDSRIIQTATIEFSDIYFD